MIGPTGVGKTEIARRLARMAAAPFIKVEATKFTEVGYVGRDVEQIIRDLVDVAITMVREEEMAKVQTQARENAELRVLDILIPASPSATIPASGARGTNDLDDDPDTAQGIRQTTRDRFRTMLKEGKLDDRMINVETEPPRSSGSLIDILGPFPAGAGTPPDGLDGLQDLMSNLGRGKRQKTRMSVRDAISTLTTEEASKLVDQQKVKKEAIARVESTGIVFIDEIDKVATSSERQGADVSRQGVQRDLLPIVEGSTVNTKQGMVKTDHILFIASGAFHLSKPSDLIPELQGRFPIRVELDSLTEDHLYRILTEPKNALLKQYEALLATEGIALTFEDEAIRAIAKTAARVNADVENIGARRLHTILTTLLEDLLFDAPGDAPSTVVITRSDVETRLGALAQNPDLSRYIL
jgi:ATP-dependent HslUV protease ATP-binding subunit HslU